MPIILPLELTSAEIRVLQEFRRLTADTLPLDKIKAIKHPTGALGEAPAASLVGKGFLSGEGDTFTVTQKAKDLLAIDPEPEFEEATTSGSSAAADAESDSV